MGADIAQRLSLAIVPVTHRIGPMKAVQTRAGVRKRGC